MLRASACALFLTLLAGMLLVPAFAGDAKEAPEKLVLASDEKAAKVLAQFKTDWKAKGLKGEDKVMQRDYALRKISKVHHPDVVAALGKASRDSHPDVRMIALIYLGDQKALTHLAAQHVLKAMRKHKKDIVLQMTGLQTLAELKYLGAQKELRVLMKHKYFVIKKAAIATVGRIGDKRMLRDVLATLGMKFGDDLKEPDKKESKKIVEEGYSWEGAEARVDYGDADNTKREIPEAKKKAEAQIAANKKAAEAGRKGGGGGGGVGGVGGSGGRGGSARSTQELIPTILKTLKALTGEEFDKPSTIRKWIKKNREQLKKDQKALDDKEQAQKAVTGK